MASNDRSKLSSTVPRPWWRLHKSTWAFAALVAGLLIAVNLMEFSRSGYPSWTGYEDLGWPWVWHVTTRSYPKYVHRAAFYENLAANATIGLAIAALASTVVEWRRRRRRRFWQLTLGELLLATAFIACLLGRYEALRKRHVAQQAACALLGKPGSVVFQSGLPDWVPKRAPGWMGGALEPFESARNMFVRELSPESDGFAPIADLTTLEIFCLSSPPRKLVPIDVNDADAAYFSGLTRLTELYLPQATISDVGLAHLRGLTRLQRLNLSLTRVTSAGMPHLADMRALESLNLSGTGVGDEGLASLAHLSSLESLDLSDTKVTGRGMASLSTLRSLESLDLEGTNLSDEGLRHLAGLPQLSALILRDTQVSDEGLESLYGLTNLRSLNLDGTNVTEVGIQRTIAAMPKMKYLRLRVE